MNAWRHAIALELKHEEKIFGGKLSKRQFIWLLPGVAVPIILFNIPFQKFWGLFFDDFTAQVIRFILLFIISFIVLLIGVIVAFIPARMIPWFKDPKPKQNEDPYDVDMTIDRYLMGRNMRKNRKKILPYRIEK